MTGQPPVLNLTSILSAATPLTPRLAQRMEDLGSRARRRGNHVLSRSKQRLVLAVLPEVASPAQTRSCTRGFARPTAASTAKLRSPRVARE